MKTNSSTIRRRAAVLACLISILGVVTAQTASAAVPPSEEPVMLSEFEVKSDPGEDYRASNVISGTKFNTKLMELPKQVDVITDKFLEDLGTPDVLEALRYNSSIQLDTAEGVEVEEPQIVIRGYRADTTYVNGFTTSQSVDRIFIDRIEIIKGPSSIFSGPIEPGGTMNTITKKPTTRVGGSLALSAGSFDRYRAEASYNTPLNASKTLTTRLVGAYEDFGSYLDFAGSKRRVMGAALQWKPTAKTTLLGEIRYTGTDKKPGDPVAYLNAATTQILRDIRPEFNRAGPFAYYHLNQYQANGEITHLLSEHWSFHAGILASYRTLNQLTIANSSTVIAVTAGVRSVPRTAIYRPRDASFSVSPQTQIVGKFNYGWVDQKFLTGFESTYGQGRSLTYSAALSRVNIDTPQPDSAYSFGDVSTYPVTANNKNWSRQWGVPVNNVFTLLGGRLILVNGLRYGSVNNDSRNIRTKAYGIPFSQSAVVSGHGVTYIVIPAKLSLFASYSESFVPLTGADFYGNPFDPIEGKGIDYGIKFDLLESRLSGSITSYVTDRDKALARDVDHAGFNVQERKQHSQGLEVGFQLHPLRDWRVLLNYGYCDIVTTGDPQAIVNNTRQRNVPTHQGNIWNRYKFSEGGLKGLSLGVGVIRLGNRRGNDTRLDIPGLQLWPFTKVDASLGYDLTLFGRRTSLQVSGTNLTNKQFIDQYRYYAAPRGFLSTLRMNF